MKIIITTLRRSGSTLFWSGFRKNDKFICYDEPFNPGLSQLPQEHKKGVYQEYVNLIRKEPLLFWSNYESINPVDENKPNLSIAQTNYLEYLLQSNENVVIDTTRCWNKTQDLIDILKKYGEDSLLIYLYRDPIAFVSSHMLPSEIKSWRVNRHLKKTFWTRNNDFNHWKMEEVLGSSLGSSFDTFILSHMNINPSSFYKSPSFQKLFHFWKYSNQQILEKISGSNIKNLIISFESFCNDPIETMKKVDNFCDTDFSKNAKSFYKSNQGFDTSNEKWNICH